MDDLGKRAFRGLAIFQVALAAMLFLPAWTLAWWQGWVVWALYLVCSALSTLYFLRQAPGLVRRRLAVGPLNEPEKAQKLFQLAASVFISAIFVVSALDHNLGWSSMPIWFVLVGDAAVVASFAAIFAVFRENEFAAATVRVEAGQRVISTGPYAVVRHPMYSGAFLLFFGTPLGLGSWWGLIPAAALMGAIILRLLDEENYLASNLPGYAEYQAKVHARLVPGVW